MPERKGIFGFGILGEGGIFDLGILKPRMSDEEWKQHCREKEEDEEAKQYSRQKRRKRREQRKR